MTVRAVLDVLKTFFRRQWLLILIAALVAAAVGYVVAGDVPDRYVAKATVRIDSSALRRFTGLTGPDALLDSVRGVDFRQEAAARVGLPADELRESLHIYTVGTPIALYVEFESEDAAEAERVAAELAALVVEWQEQLSILDLGKQRILVEESRETLAFLEDVQMESGWEESDLEFKLWNVRRDLATNEAILLSMEQVYTVDGDPVIETVSGTRERMVTTLGAGLVGLFFGTLVAAVRERRIRESA